MDIHRLLPAHADWIREAAALLAEVFPWAYPDQAAGLAEMAACLAPERIALVAVVHDRVAGFTGAIPQYGTTGWELHPLAVARAFRNQGFGTALVRRLEDEVRALGGITLYLGSDDEFGQTSLSGGDLYDHLWERIRDIRNPGSHAYAFYQKLGYQIVGVIPDANGFGKPDIFMARRLREPDAAG